MDDVQLREILRPGVTGFLDRDQPEGLVGDREKKLFRAGCHEVARILRIDVPKFVDGEYPSNFHSAWFVEGPGVHLNEVYPYVSAFEVLGGRTTFNRACADFDRFAQLFPPPLEFLPFSMTSTMVTLSQLRRTMPRSICEQAAYWMRFDHPRDSIALGSIVFNCWD